MIAGVIDLRSPSQQESYWRTAWRLRCAANPRIKAANLELAEWHKPTSSACSCEGKPNDLHKMRTGRRVLRMERENRQAMHQMPESLSAEKIYADRPASGEAEEEGKGIRGARATLRRAA